MDFHAAIVAINQHLEAGIHIAQEGIFHHKVGVGNQIGGAISNGEGEFHIARAARHVIPFTRFSSHRRDFAATGHHLNFANGKGISIDVVERLAQQLGLGDTGWRGKGLPAQIRGGNAVLTDRRIVAALDFQGDRRQHGCARLVLILEGHLFKCRLAFIELVVFVIGNPTLRKVFLRIGGNYAGCQTIGAGEANAGGAERRFQIEHISAEAI